MFANKLVGINNVVVRHAPYLYSKMYPVRLKIVHHKAHSAPPRDYTNFIDSKRAPLINEANAWVDKNWSNIKKLVKAVAKEKFSTRRETEVGGASMYFLNEDDAVAVMQLLQRRYHTTPLFFTAFTMAEENKELALSDAKTVFLRRPWLGKFMWKFEFHGNASDIPSVLAHFEQDGPISEKETTYGNIYRNKNFHLVKQQWGPARLFVRDESSAVSMRLLLSSPHLKIKRVVLVNQ